jgi:hypothetical protein
MGVDSRCEFSAPGGTAPAGCRHFTSKSTYSTFFQKLSGGMENEWIGFDDHFSFRLKAGHPNYA